MNIKQKLTWLSGTALLAMSLNASAFDVDLFSTTQAQLVDTTTGDGGLESSVGAGDPTILGGSRDLYVEMLTQAATNPNGTADIGVAGGALSFSTDSGVTGTGWVQWDGNDGSIALNETGLGGIDLTAGGQNAFAVTTIASDLGYEFVVTAYTDATHWTSISFSATAVDGNLPPVTSFIDFAGFTNAALCGLSTNPPLPAGVNSISCAAGNQVVDLANLGALELKIDPNGGTVSVDLTIDQIVTVPEPSVLGLLGLGLLVGGLTSLRRRKSS